MKNNKVVKYAQLWISMFLLIGAILPVEGQQAEHMLSLRKIKRVLFLGNSITYAGGFVNMFETYCIATSPAHQFEVINEGLPSETVSGLSEVGHADGKFSRPCLFTRLPLVLEKTKADMVFACYGMNDGIYLPFDEERFNAYKTGMLKLHDALEASGVKRIIFMTPPVHDDQSLGVGGYNKVLDRYADWLLQQRKERKWEVVDLHFPMKEYLINKKKIEPDFKLANDGVHPGELGHWLMARPILSYIGANELRDIPTWDDYLESKPFLPELYDLVTKRQAKMKDAWLTATKHDRPGMTPGLPMKEARKFYDDMERKIQELLR